MGGDLFAGQDARRTLMFYLDDIENEIKSKGTEYVLGVDHDEWLNYFILKKQIVPLELLEDQISTQYEGKISRVIRDVPQQAHYTFKVIIPFLGHGFLFHLKPSQFLLKTYYGEVLCISVNGELIKTISLTTEDKEEFYRQRDSFIAFVKKNIPYINEDVVWFNSQIEPRFREVVGRIADLKNKELQFLKELEIPINEETVKIFQVPKLEAPVIKQPTHIRSKITGRDELIPAVSNEFYNDVCSIINTIYKSVEKKPGIYKSRDEEELRDYVLPILETRYENTTATGETFNKEGKTDILLRYEDGTNLFIAECKFWNGSKEASDALDQLFDRYITWRDTKVALIFFVREKAFTDIIKKADEVIRKHKYYIKTDKQIDESVFQYNMHVPNDKDKPVELRILLFAFP